MDKCIVEGCNKDKYHSKYYCSMHYRRLKIFGSLEDRKKSPAPLEVRFWRNVDKKSDHECWNWKLKVGSKGYANLGSGGKNGKMLLAHRYSYELHKGEIPKDLYVMHMCDNPRCVNPNHLMIGTPKDNTQDALKKNRLKTGFVDGENHLLAKLNNETVKIIKSNTELKSVELSKMFNISPQTICDIRKGRRWKEVI
jgi:hypothetical protein